MNRQELIEKIENEKFIKNNSDFEIGYNLASNTILRYIEHLDEPEKVTIPQFVADYIKDAKYYEWDLDDVFDHIAEESEESEIYKWFYTLGNVDVFARAWLDGYEVEKEKRYLVKIKNLNTLFCYLAHSDHGNYWSITYSKIDGLSTKHTRKELEEAGFGWVFDCEGIEIEEVE